VARDHDPEGMFWQNQGVRHVPARLFSMV